MNSRSISSPGGVPFCTLLTILFIGLKLTDHIDWSWWWVLSPLWLPAAIIFVLAVLAAMIAGVLR